MNQVGDVKHFTMSVLPTGTNIYSYVWKWWDGTSEATTEPAATKVVNQGGYPDDGMLHYSCTAVAVDGQEVTVNGTFEANNPAIIFQPTISVNDAYLPYSTRLGLYALDVDDARIVQTFIFMWYSGTNFLGHGLLGTPVATNGTWIGNGIHDVRSYLAHENHYYVNVFSDRTIRCQVVDGFTGTTNIEFDLRGYARPAPPTGVIATPASILTDIFSLPIQRIHPGAYFDFQVIAKDVSGGPLEFHWSFAGSNNWTVPREGRGSSTNLPDGSVRNIYQKDISAEVVTVGTQKTVVGECIILGQSARSDVRVEVVLYENTSPTTGTVTIRNAVTQAVYTDLDAVPKEDQIQYEAAVTDPDGDVVTVKWLLSLSSPSVAKPTSYTFWGPKIIVTPAGVFEDGYASAGCRITGYIEVYDRLGAGPSVYTVSTVTLT